MMRWADLLELRESCEYDPEGEDVTMDALIAYKDALEERALTPKDAVDLRIRFDRELRDDQQADAAAAFAAQLLPALVEGKPLPPCTGPGPERTQGPWGFGRARVTAIEDPVI